MTTENIRAGNLMHSVWTATTAGSINLAQVTARVLTPSGVQTLTPAQDSANVFSTDILIPRDTVHSHWIVEWASAAPSPVLTEESKFQVLPLTLPAP